MKTCAGCSPIENKTHLSRVPSCLEPIVFASGSADAAARSRHSSYQCMACDRIWIFEGRSGYSSLTTYQRAA